MHSSAFVSDPTARILASLGPSSFSIPQNNSCNSRITFQNKLTFSWLTRIHQKNICTQAFNHIQANDNSIHANNNIDIDGTANKSRRQFLQVAANASLFSFLMLATEICLGHKFTAANSAEEEKKTQIQMGESRGLDGPLDQSLPKFHKIDNGVKVQDVRQGQGATVEAGKRISVNYVLRRANGYFVDASYGFDRFETYNFTFGKGEVIPGFEKGIEGMQEGGRRRFIVEPDLGYVNGGTSKTSPGPIPPDWGARRSLTAHMQEPLIFEVQLVKVRDKTP